MPNPVIRDLGTIDIGVGGTTNAFPIAYQHGFSICPTVVGTAGTSTYTLRVSHDDVTYKDYVPSAVAVPIDDAVDRNTFNWKYLKILVTPGGPSAGTAQFSILMKGT